MKLYSGPLSLYTAKTRIALAEKGLDYELISVNWSRVSRYEPKHPDVVRINPKEQVPCLVDDGGVEIYDSTLIAEYLEDRYPSPALFPTEPAAKAACRLLELEADEVLFPSVWTLIATRFYPPGDDAADDSAERAAVDSIGRYYDRLEAKIGGREWLAGVYSVADIAHYVFFSAAAGLGEAIPERCPNLLGWLERMSARPAVAAEAAGLAAATEQALAA